MGCGASTAHSARYAAQEETFFLPKELRGKTILKQQSDGSFLVDTAELQKETGRSGVAHRRSKHVEDKVRTSVNHGATIRGFDEGDGWIKVEVIKANSTTPLPSCFVGGLHSDEAARVRQQFLNAFELQLTMVQVEKKAGGGLTASAFVKRTKKRKEEAAKKLRAKGFTVDQLLRFYSKYHSSGHIKAGVTTNDVVRNIVLPETAAPPRCYMESAFMQDLGGGQPAEKFVAHAWNSEFVNTILNILLDATGKQGNDFNQDADWPGGARAKIFDGGILKTNFLLEVLPAAVLAKTYWLCIFAINEHAVMCGDCWECNKTSEWKADVAAHLRADPCLICQKAKVNPCSCGSVKLEPGDPNYELDLLDHVVSKMDALVVSLDADLKSLRRVWVLADIGKALHVNTISFRWCSPLSQSSIDKLHECQPLMASVADCDATRIEDKARIISDICNTQGGVPAFDDFINCMLELQFGICSRLVHLEGTAARAAANLQKLEVDLTWTLRTSTGLNALADCCSFFPKLRTFALNCSNCSSLSSIDELGNGLSHCQALTSATFNFQKCTGLSCIDEFGKGLGHCKALASAKFYFYGCTCLISIDELGKGLAQCQALASAIFEFEGCRYLTSVDELGKGLSQCKALASAIFYFFGCTGLTSIDELGMGLSQCHALASAVFDFEGCRDLTSIDELGKGLGHCQALASATFGFFGCTGLTSIDEFGQGLGKCTALASATFYFCGCTRLTSIAEFERGLSQCHALTSATFDLRKCKGIASLNEFGKGLSHCQTLKIRR